RLDPAALRQLDEAAALPGRAGAAVLMPDGHSGFGFPIGGVVAFDPAAGGVVCAGGVGYDIACGVRCLATGLTRDDVLARQEALAEALFRAVPAGVGRGGALRLEDHELDAMLRGGAAWAVGQGLGRPEDLSCIEERGRMAGADPAAVSAEAKARMRDQLGTLGSGNHYLELQWVAEALDPARAAAYGIREGDAVLSIHCGSRGLGHQVCADYAARMLEAAPRFGLTLPNRDLACAPADSDLGRAYLAAMRCGVNCALANRQAVAHLACLALAQVCPQAAPRLVYDVSHNTCKLERHAPDGRERALLVHRKGATRALGPGSPDLPAAYRLAGQPVLLGGSMGAASYILAGLGEAGSFASAPHGAGRALSRAQARKRFKGAGVVRGLGLRGVLVRSADLRGVAEEAPEAYKDIEAVVRAAAGAGLAAPVARLLPLVCVKG
ncbi:MAG: RtcB family protein, partial [Desulfovibrionaceae bacterium]